MPVTHHTTPIRTVTAPDGSYTVVVDDIVFGPYGPKRCEEVYPYSTARCRHMNRHVGSHTAELPGMPAGKVDKYTESRYTVRWSTT